MVFNKIYNLYSPAKINFYLKVIKKLFVNILVSTDNTKLIENMNFSNLLRNNTNCAFKFRI